MRRLLPMAWGGLLVAPILGVLPCSGQTSYVAEGGEYSIAGSIVGDQVHPCLALDTSTGFVVWQDNATDGSGLGISAMRLDGNFSPLLSPFRVNSEGAGNQENPAVSLLPYGGVAFVWQGNLQGKAQIYARFLAADYTWVGGDVLVNDLTGDLNTHPVMASRNNSSVIIAWNRHDEVGQNGYDVYARRLTSTGSPVGEEFRINQTTASHQRDPDVAVLSDGRTSVIVWVSHGQRAPGSSDIYARKFSLRGLPLTGEILVNSSVNQCVNPSVTSAEGGGFVVAWEERSLTAPSTDSLDVFARVFDGAGSGGAARRVNETVYGDQYKPRIASQGSDYLVVWTSIGQDGSREGVYGRFLDLAGSPVGGEFRVNSTTGGPQIHATVGAGASNRFAVAWSTYVGGANSFDLMAQRYAPFADPLIAPDAPYVSPLSTTSLAVTWPALEGYDVASYGLYVDDSDSPVAVVPENWFTLTNLEANTSYSIRLTYTLADGRTSPLSAPTVGTTYGQYGTYLWYDVIPADWMTTYYGNTPWLWPQDVNGDLDGDGASLYNEFLAGTDPTDPASVLKMHLANTSQGLFLSWNTVPGQIYQVQSSSNGSPWTNLGSPRLAADTIDSLLVGSSPVGIFRVVRVR